MSGLFRREGAASGFTMDIQHALIVILLGAVLADKIEGEEEMMFVRHLMAKSPIFERNTDRMDKRILEACRTRIHGDPGVVQEAARFLPEALRETAFAMSLEIVFADGVVNRGERDFIHMLARQLDIDTDLAAPMIKTFAALYRGYQPGVA